MKESLQKSIGRVQEEVGELCDESENCVPNH